MNIKIIVLCCSLATFILAGNKTLRNKNLSDPDITSTITNLTLLGTDSISIDTTVCIIVCRDTNNINCPYLKINRIYFYDQPIAIDLDGQPINTWGQACTDSVANDWNIWIPQLINMKIKRANKIINDSLNNWFVDSTSIGQTKHDKIRNKNKRWQNSLGTIKIKKVAK